MGGGCPQDKQQGGKHPIFRKIEMFGALCTMDMNIERYVREKIDRS